MLLSFSSKIYPWVLFNSKNQFLLKDIIRLYWKPLRPLQIYYGTPYPFLEHFIQPREAFLLIATCFKFFLTNSRNLSLLRLLKVFSGFFFFLIEPAYGFFLQDNYAKVAFCLKCPISSTTVIFIAFWLRVSRSKGYYRIHFN